MSTPLLPPAWLGLRVGSARGRGFRFCFPLFVLWPLLFIVLLLFAPFVFIAGLIFLRRLSLAWTLTLAPVWLMAALRGLKVDVNSADEKVFISIH